MMELDIDGWATRIRTRISCGSRQGLEMPQPGTPVWTSSVAIGGENASLRIGPSFQRDDWCRCPKADRREVGWVLL
jgi:hypothetical protein